MSKVVLFPKSPYLAVRQGPKTWIVELVTPVGDREYRSARVWFRTRGEAIGFAKRRAAAWGCRAWMEGTQ